MNNDSALSFGIGLLAGAAIGLAIGLLYAPKSGAETRQLISERTGGVVEAVKEKATEVKEKVAEVKGKLAGKPAGEAA